MNIQGGRRKAEGGVAQRRGNRRTRSPFPLPPSDFRPGLTLIELLITITIVATLSAVFLGASRSATESARAARTKSTIAKLHSLIMEKWVSFATRRVDVNTSTLTAAQLADGRLMAGLRLFGTRELMKLEMPDRWSDIMLRDIPDGSPSSITEQPPQVLQNRPALSSIYVRRFEKAASVKNDGVILRRNQGAECLYMIIMLATGDGEARTLFSQQDIGDTDEDGAPEFLDGWGNPIQFIRWPAGFVSNSDLMSGDADSDHDPFDYFRRDIDAFRLVPLIYSVGPDSDGDLILDPGAIVGIDPYINTYGPSGNHQLGTAMSSAVDPSNDGDNWIDNIHNHLQDNR